MVVVSLEKIIAKSEKYMFLLFNLGTGEIIIILVVILLLFGAKRIPDLMKSMGKGVRSFKEGMNEVNEELKKPIEDDKKEGK